MIKYDELGYEEREEISELFANWLKDYSREVIMDVMAKAEEIINNEFSMNLLRELKVREEKEHKDFTSSIEMLFRDYEGFNKYNPHSHVLEHSDSYRDVLYDMYIK